MNHVLKAILATAVVGFTLAGAAPADAKGCLKGAVVGGVAGHMAGHGVLGAAGGCAVGHHMANKAERNNVEQESGRQATPAYSPNRQ